MRKFTSYGLFLMAVILAGLFALEGSWVQSAIMCISAWLAFDTIRMQRNKGEGCITMYKLSRWFGNRAVLSVKASKELWFNNLRDGERMTHLFNVGIYTRPETQPGIRLFSVTVLWLSVQIGLAAPKTTAAKEPS